MANKKEDPEKKRKRQRSVMKRAACRRNKAELKSPSNKDTVDQIYSKVPKKEDGANVKQYGPNKRKIKLQKPTDKVHKTHAKKPVEFQVKTSEGIVGTKTLYNDAGEVCSIEAMVGTITTKTFSKPDAVKKKRAVPGRITRREQAKLEKKLKRVENAEARILKLAERRTRRLERKIRKAERMQESQQQAA